MALSNRFVTGAADEVNVSLNDSVSEYIEDRKYVSIEDLSEEEIRLHGTLKDMGNAEKIDVKFQVIKK